jgi:hypothetical protein
LCRPFRDWVWGGVVFCAFALIHQFGVDFAPMQFSQRVVIGSVFPAVGSVRAGVCVRSRCSFCGGAAALSGFFWVDCTMDAMQSAHVRRRRRHSSILSMIFLFGCALALVLQVNFSGCL